MLGDAPAGANIPVKDVEEARRFQARASSFESFQQASAAEPLQYQQSHSGQAQLSAPSIRPVGPAPTTITSASVTGHSPSSFSTVPATHTSSIRQEFHDSELRRFWLGPTIMRHDRSLAASPLLPC